MLKYYGFEVSQSGSLIDQAGLPAGATVEKVTVGGKDYVLEDDTLTIETEDLGQLTIADDGTYEYEVEKGAVAVGDARTDVFTVTIRGADGETETVPLSIRTVGSSQGTAGDDVMALTGTGTTASGLGGDDRYVVDVAGDTVVEAAGGGFDTIETTVGYSLAPGQEIEILRLSDPDGTSNLNLTGNEFDQMLVGNAGNNRLDGGGGADLLMGGEGDDTYVVDEAGDIVLELPGEGFDRVEASVSVSLADSDVEMLTLTGTGAIDGIGQGLDNRLVGNAAGNTLDGRGGDDAMAGGAGDDVYGVDSLGDRVVEAVGGGDDRVFARSDYALAAGQEIEALQLLAATGRAGFNLTGNEFGQRLVGNNGANSLDGRGGHDLLIGRGGADTFVFSSPLEAANVDRIGDFTGADTIALSKGIFASLAPGPLAASAFKNLTTGKIDADDRILYKQATGELFYDADGSGKAGAVKFAVLDNKAALTHADFLVG